MLRLTTYANDCGAQNVRFASDGFPVVEMIQYSWCCIESDFALLETFGCFLAQNLLFLDCFLPTIYVGIQRHDDSGKSIDKAPVVVAESHEDTDVMDCLWIWPHTSVLVVAGKAMMVCFTTCGIICQLIIKTLWRRARQKSGQLRWPVMRAVPLCPTFVFQRER